MEEKKTVQYKRTMRGTLGAGASALFNGNGRRFYILEHRDASKYHKAGESQKIIIDQIELGRGRDCQVRFDESFETVSRRHAAIVRDGDRWKLVQLSTTNTTFLNGRAIDTEWYLQNGDEIQLAIGGPRLGFIVPEGKQGLVSSIKITQRIKLASEQALKPYKRAITAMAIIIILLSCGSGYKLYELHQQNLYLSEQQEYLKAANDTLHGEIIKQATTIASQVEDINRLDQKNKNLVGQLSKLRKDLNNIKPSPVINNLDEYSKDVYFIGLKGYTITSPDGETAALEPGDSIWGEKVPFRSGTGFILNDGTFVTARHVVEPWFFGSSTIDINMNHLSCIGYKIVGHFFGLSSSGTPLEFSTNQCKVNRTHDRVGDVKITEDKALKLRLAASDNTDYASCANLGNGSLIYDSSLSKNLKVGEKLKILGFPLGLGASSKSITPIYSSADVAKDGLTEDGYILTTATGFEHGNSGGPVFAERDGKMIVIGIVSAGGGRSTGFVVPISVVK